jgi:hypothetical protein
MILLLVAAILGGCLTTAMIWSLSPLVALTSAPIGGSLFALAAGVLSAHLKRKAGMRLSRRKAA